MIWFSIQEPAAIFEMARHHRNAEAASRQAQTKAGRLAVHGRSPCAARPNSEFDACGDHLPLPPPGGVEERPGTT
jgi:hypothetical protein